MVKNEISTEKLKKGINFGKLLYTAFIVMSMMLLPAMAVMAEEIADYESTKTVTSYIKQGNNMVSIQYVLPKDVPPETVAQGRLFWSDIFRLTSAQNRRSCRTEY